MRSLTRRKAIAGLLAANAVTLAPRVSRAAGIGRPRFVLVALRGALDGLAAVPAWGDAQYRRARAGLALEAPGMTRGTIDLDGFFGLHPSLAPIHAMYEAGEALVIPAVATGSTERSHAPAQRMLDNRLPGASQGWLARAAAYLAEMQDIEPAWFPTAELSARSDGMLPDLMTDLCHGDPALALAIAADGAGFDVSMTREIQAGAFREAARATGEWLSASDARRIAMIESFGWDTHSDQGSHDGRLAGALAGLADGLVALAAACGDAWRDTVLLVATEFGRSVGMNRMGGTDHGAASVAFLMGGAVAGGHVTGRWPGLAPKSLYRGRDLRPTTDVHAICKAVLLDHLGLPHHAVDRLVFSGHSAVKPLSGLFRA